MYANILIPVALEHEMDIGPALEIARCLRADGGKITILNVMEAIPSYVAAQMPEGMLEEARGSVERSVEDLARGAGGAASWAVINGTPGNAIVDYAEKHGADCIIVASHKPGLSDYFLGSTAARVVRHAPCAVHVIR